MACGIHVVDMAFYGYGDWCVCDVLGLGLLSRRLGFYWLVKVFLVVCFVFGLFYGWKECG